MPAALMYVGNVLEFRLDADGSHGVMLGCPPQAIPAPGQYLLAHAPHDQDEGLAWALYPRQIAPGGFVAAPPHPPGWALGARLHLRGPLGKGFNLAPIHRNLALVALCIFGGMSAAKVRTDFVDTTMIERPVRAKIKGIVLQRELRPRKRLRYTIKIVGFDSRSKVVPQIIRASASAKYPVVAIGEGVFGLVSLRPPSGPAYPGGYDFSFQAWFNGIGANGFFLGKPVQTDIEANLSLLTTINLAVSKARSSMAERIRQALPGERGSLAAALIVGDRSGIGEDTAEALRQSGLAHILAISGLHMALVTATIIFFVRGSLALLPGIALYYPIRKWAAVAALFSASVYLIISGASIATQRAWIMIVIMLLAILLDRKALTMRNVGLAALAVLVWRPESIISPGFQMSFAAVAALIAVYETWARYRQNRIYREPANRFRAILGSGIKGISGLAVTSLIAGMATGLFAAYHFHRFAPLGLIANLAAMPLVSLIVMPMALVSVILMPFGLEQYALAIMGAGIDQVVDVASRVAGAGPSGNTGFLPLATLLLGSMALVIATQFKSWLRLMFLPVLALAILDYANRQFPDILVSESGSAIAIRSDEGELLLLNPRREKFITTIWRKAFSSNQVLQNSSKSANPLRCDNLGCTALLEDNVLLAIPKRPEAFHEDCFRANIIVTRLQVPEGCSGPALVIDRAKLKQQGSHLITVSAGADADPVFSVEQAYSKFHRPWSRHRN